MKLLTNSSMNTSACLRRYYYAYENGLRKIEDALPLRVGTIVHDMLDRRAKGERVAQLIHEIPPMFDEEQQDIAYMIRALLVCYDFRWADMDSDMTVIASEIPFEIPINNPDSTGASKTFRYAGKIDKIVRIGDKTYVMEHKTSASAVTPGCDYIKRLAIDSQVSLYWLAASELGYDVAGVLYDVLRKPLHRPKKLTQGDTKRFYDTGKYPDVETGPYDFDVCLRGMTVNGVTPEMWPGAKSGTFAIRETPEMFEARLCQTIMTDPEDSFFCRMPIPRTEADLRETQYELWQTSQLLRECKTRNIWPKRTSQCVGFGVCPYFDICTSGGWQPDQMVPDGYHVVNDPHPELQEAQPV